ncbi:M20/M25/M40 family metallo-hydrolase [Curtobacterium flaccumfaciens]|nr:M20/M25/M40 family metallo-hydrolase [Curtobacterium flaccumfaciens]
MLLLGSHLDTVVDAGRYDGIVGVLMAIRTAARLTADGPLPVALQVIAFSDEEGTPLRQGPARVVRRGRGLGRRLVGPCRR